MKHRGTQSQADAWLQMDDCVPLALGSFLRSCAYLKVHGHRVDTIYVGQHHRSAAWRMEHPQEISAVDVLGWRVSTRSDFDEFHLSRPHPGQRVPSFPVKIAALETYWDLAIRSKIDSLLLFW